MIPLSSLWCATHIFFISRRKCGVGFFVCLFFSSLFGQISSTTVSTAKRRQITTVANVSQGIYKNSANPEEENRVKQVGAHEQDKRKWLCLLLLLIFRNEQF